MIPDTDENARWGVVATIRAPREDLLRFCAFHLHAGADRLFIYLDDANADTHQVLSAHPRIRSVMCNARFWEMCDKTRPKKHQARQSHNANHAYRSATGLDWLAHIDVDEFVMSPCPIAKVLAELPPDVLCARVRPAEALAGAPDLFKRPVRKGPRYNAIMEDLYPDWASQIKGGLLSHVLGKLFVRVGIRGLRLKIHNAFLNGSENPGLHELADMDLAHLHAPSWDHFRAAFPYRLEHGSYRRDLGPNRRREHGGVTLHEVLDAILAEHGEAGLQRFYTHVCSARPDLIKGLRKHGLLLRADLQLTPLICEHFPALFDASVQDC